MIFYLIYKSCFCYCSCKYILLLLKFDFIQPFKDAKIVLNYNLQLSKLLLWISKDIILTKDGKITTVCSLYKCTITWNYFSR